MSWRLPHNPTAYDDDWEDQPGQGPLYQWGLGVAVPLVLFAYGIYAVVAQQAHFGGEMPMAIRGLNATAFGIAWASAGLFLHCHFFWGNVFNQAWLAVLGKIIGACGFIAGMAFVVVRNGVFGIG